MFNFLKSFFCKLPKHAPRLRYSGMNVLGYVCENCGFQWYEDRVRQKPDLKVIKDELLCCNPFTNKKINHLLNKVNRVTSSFRCGRKVSDKDLTALYKAQLEFERKLKEETTPTQKDMGEKFTI